MLRELYREAELRNDAPTMQRLDEAHDMAKRMQRKLMAYNKHEIYPSVKDVCVTGDQYRDHPLWGDKSTLKETDA